MCLDISHITYVSNVMRLWSIASCTEETLGLGSRFARIAAASLSPISGGSVVGVASVSAGGGGFSLACEGREMIRLMTGNLGFG